MDNFQKFYNKLNTQQKKATDTIDGAVLILAGPGTGKTELLSIRAANIIRKKKAQPENILILTYTNTAAKAMKERLAKIIGPRGYEIEVSTFHSFANSIILQSEEAANYIQEKIEITDIEKIRVLEYILDNTEGIDAIRPFRAPYTYRSEIEKRISELKKEGISPEDFQKTSENITEDNVYIQDKHVPRLKAFAKVYKLYEAYKRGENADVFDQRGRYDFDDMIMIAHEAVRKEGQLKEQLKDQYTYVMVDEYQDTNGAQLNLLFEIIDDKNTNICCVGDDDQSIYRFQGASVGNFKAFKERFHDLSLVSLKENYRSSEQIIDITKKVIGQLPEKERMAVKQLKNTKSFKDKIIDFSEFSTETEELLHLAAQIQKLKKNISYNDIAVLVRKRDDILKLIDIFQKKGIPYATDGKENIANEIRVRQMLDVLYLAYTRDTTDAAERDAYFYRVISSDYFRISMNDILTIINITKQKKWASRAATTLLTEFIAMFPVRDLESDTPPSITETKKLPVLKKASFKNTNKLHFASWAINRLLSKAQSSPTHTILMHFIKDARIYAYILEEHKNEPVLRIRDIRALSSFINMVKISDITFPGINLSEFIKEIELRKEHNMPLQGNLVTQTQEGVRVYTAHGSKGLEFHTVFIPFCLQDKNWPVRPRPVLIPLPPAIFKTKEKVKDKSEIKKLNLYDEIRLFYVATSRAKSQLYFTASPRKNTVTSFYIERIGLDVKTTVQKEQDVISASLSLTDQRQPFIDTEKILKNMVDELSLNPTSINNYIMCKRKFMYNNVLQIPSTKKRALVFGTCVHKALEDTYKKYKQTKKFPDFSFFRKSFIGELDFQGVEKSIYVQCEREIDNLAPWFENESKKPIMPLGLEQRLAVDVEDVLFKGYYDKTEIIDEQKRMIRVVDYKTGKPDNHLRAIESCDDLSSDECDGYFRQIVAYKFLFDRAVKVNKGYKVDAGKLVFIDSAEKKNFKNLEIKISESKVAELEKLVKDCWKRIKNLEFEKLPEPDKKKCGTIKNIRCDYYDICWGGKQYREKKKVHRR